MLTDGRKCDEEIDKFGLLACQNYNLGNDGNWFFSFRSGLSGSRSRMLSLEEHRALVYEWHPSAMLHGHERHIAIMLFCMDSAFECLVFALNALGQARDTSGFRDVTDDIALRKIAPRDVIGAATTGQPLAGWLNLFPTFQRHCASNSKLLSLIVENHDVTKHRQSGFEGGKVRSDPPPGFFERLGIPEGHPTRHLIAPMQEVLLPLEPKLPMDARSPKLADLTRLELVIPQFRQFVNDAICLANADAHSTFKLPVAKLRVGHVGAT